MKKVLSLFLFFGLLLSLTACGTGENEIPNVFGIDYNQAVEVLEDEGFEVKTIEASASQIFKNLSWPLDSVDKGTVFKIDDYILDGCGDIVLNYNTEVETMTADDNKVIIYYAKEDYVSEDYDDDDFDFDDDFDEEEEETTTTAKKTSATKKKTTKKSSSSSDWREFLKDYEAWVDDYIEIIKKYKSNPSDMSILSEYTDMVSKASEWSTKAYDFDIEDTDEYLEYMNELNKILKKITDATK